MRKIAVVIGLALIVAIGFLLIAPGYIDWSKRKEQIVAQLNQATGLNFQISGDLELALLPFPRVMIEGLSVSNPDHQGKTLIAIKRAEASLALAPLFSGNIEVDSVSLVEPQITLEVGPQGEKSWMTGALKEGMEKDTGSESSGLANSISLDAIKIKDGRFLYINKQAGQRYELAAINLSLWAKTIQGPFDVKGGFTYNGQAISIDAESERLQEGTLPLRVTLGIPGLGSNLAFSGVVALENGQDVQGQASLETASLGRLASFVGEANNISGLDKPFSGKGMLTVSPDTLALRDAEISFAGIKSTGKLVLKGVQTEGKSASLDVDLKASTPVDLTVFTNLPGAVSAKNSKKTNVTKAEKNEIKTFIPETLTLPLDIAANIHLSAPAILVADGEISDVVANMAFVDRQAKGALKGMLPGKGQIDLSYSLAYESASRSEKKGAVTYSDPNLSYKIVAQAEEGAKAVAAFADTEQARRFYPLVQGRLAAEATGNVSPSQFTVTGGQLDVGGSSLITEGRYILRDGRDKVEASFNTSGTNIDSWLDKFTPAKPPKHKVNGGSASSFQQVTQSFLLPVDLDLTLAAKDIRLGGSDYSLLNLMLEQDGQALTLETLEVRDEKGNSLLASGKVNDLRNLQGITLAAEAKTSNLRELLAGVNIDTTQLPKEIKTAQLIGEIKGSADKAAFTANVAAMNGTVDVTGVASDLLSKPSFSGLTARIKHPNYTELAQVFKPDFRSTVAVSKAMDIYANMKREGAVYSFSDLQATIGPSTITGTLSVDKKGLKPFVTADLKAGTLPLDKILGHDADHKGSVRAQPLGGNETVRWSRNAFDTAWMHKVNFDVVLAAETFSYGPWVLNDALLDAELKDGILSITPVKGDMYGGQGNITAKATSSGKERIPLDANAAVNLANINLQSFIRAFSGTQLVRAEGDISLASELRTTGLSPAALIFSLRGKGSASGSDLIFEGFDLAKLSALLAQPSSSMTGNLSALLNTSMQGGNTRFDSLAASYTISEGIVQFSELKLMGPDAVVTGIGTVNLPVWAMDMTMTIDLVEPADAPPLRVTFKGPLNNPGQTFGRSALESYFQGLLGKELQNVIGKQLEGKGVLPKLEQKGILPLLEGTGILPKTQKQPQAQPAPAPKTEAPAAPAIPQNEGPTTMPDQEGGAGVAQPESVPAEAEQPAPQPESNDEVEVQDIFRGVLEGLLERQ